MLTSRLNACNGQANQKWNIVVGTTAVKLAGTNYCLDAGSNPANGVQAKVWTVSSVSTCIGLGIRLMEVLRRYPCADVAFRQRRVDRLGRPIAMSRPDGRRCDERQGHADLAMLLE